MVCLERLGTRVYSDLLRHKAKLGEFLVPLCATLRQCWLSMRDLTSRGMRRPCAWNAGSRHIHYVSERCLRLAREAFLDVLGCLKYSC